MSQSATPTPVPASTVSEEFRLIRSFNNLEDSGMNNAGISLVEQTCTGALCIEKCLMPSSIQSGLAAREITTLKQLRNHLNITHMIKATFDQGKSNIGWPRASIYLSYCDGGSLKELIRQYIRAGVDVIIPEAFLWEVFSSLAEAVRYCQRGKASNEVRDKSWSIVCHMDIQPANVFLHSNNKTCAGYPRVVLGDFGCSTTFHDIVTKQSASFELGPFIYAYAAPEAPRFTLRSDVYQIGLTMAALMFREYYPDKETVVEDVLNAESYSEELRLLVSWCLGKEWKERLKVEELVELVGFARVQLNGDLEGEVLLLVCEGNDSVRRQLGPRSVF